VNFINALKLSFSKQLQEKLRSHYGKIPSCSTFARDFSLLARDVEPISVETARKWIRGKAMPHASRLRVLCAWLKIDYSLSEEDIKEFRTKPSFYIEDNGTKELLQITQKLQKDEVKALTEIAKLYLKQRKL
jgi:transcriptional regulator with XRE-family HTH domain